MPSSSEKWNWDWCNRPVSALPTDRVDSLLSKFDQVLSSSIHGRRGVSTSTQKSPGAVVGVRGSGGIRRNPTTTTTAMEAAVGPPASTPDLGPHEAAGDKRVAEEKASADGARAGSPIATNENNVEVVAFDVDAIAKENTGGKAGTSGRRRSGSVQTGKTGSKRTVGDDELAEAPKDVGPEVDVSSGGSTSCHRQASFRRAIVPSARCPLRSI